MDKINREWHEAHPMPKHATEDQRIALHTEHLKRCGCREIEGGVTEISRERDIPIRRRLKLARGDRRTSVTQKDFVQSDLWSQSTCLHRKSWDNRPSCFFR